MSHSLEDIRPIGCPKIRLPILISFTSFICLLLFGTAAVEGRPYFKAPVKIQEISRSGYDDGFPWISHDGLRIYYHRDMQQGLGLAEIILFAQRDSLSSPFSTPVTVGGLGSYIKKHSPWLSPDEKAIYYTVRLDGPPEFVETTIVRAERNALNEPFSNIHELEELRRSLPVPNSAEGSFTDDELLVIYGCAGTVYQATRTSKTESFGSIIPIQLNGVAPQNNPRAFSLSGDGLRLFFASANLSGNRDYDIWYTSRSSRSSAFLPPEPITELNTSDNEVAAWSEVDRSLYLSRSTAGMMDTADIYYAEPDLDVDIDANILPSSPRTDDDLQCNYQITNNGGYPSLDTEFQWFRNGEALLEGMTVDETFYSVTGPILSRHFTQKADFFYCSIRVTDGQSDAMERTASVTIRNTTPTTPVVKIIPDDPRPWEGLAADIIVYSIDADNDPIGYEMRWYRSQDGGLTYVYKAEVSGEAPGGTWVPPAFLANNDLWRVEVIPFEKTIVRKPKTAGLEERIEGNIGWDQVFVGDNTRPRFLNLSPESDLSPGTSPITIQWESIDSDGDPVSVDLYYDDNFSKGDSILIASGLSASGSFSWTPFNAAFQSGNSDNQIINFQNLFVIGKHWQDPTDSQSLYIFARVWDSKGAMGEAFSPGKVSIPAAIPNNAEGVHLLHSMWHGLNQ